MKKIFLTFFLTNLTLFYVVLAASPSFLKTSDGVIVYTDLMPDGKKHAVKLEVVSSNIIRVIVSPDGNISPKQSLITAYSKKTDIFWTISPVVNKVILKTKSLIVEVEKKNGIVSFFDNNYKKIVAEKSFNSRVFLPVVAEGKSLYKISQSFQTTPAEGWYGLGQHQQGIMNLKGHQIDFFQNNTEVAIPFWVSSNNYGIIWDNYSFTKAGSIKPILPLSALKLFSKTGEEGWLTATYANNKLFPENISISRAESEINMPFLGDSKVKLPKEFKPETGVVSWEGSISSPLSGLHMLKFVMGGSLKLWVNNKLVIDRWRKAWNPVQILHSLLLKKDEKVSVKIEWIPEGGESYFSAEWQPPVSDDEKNTFTFCSDAGKQIDYYFLKGNNIDSVIANYRYITGKAPIVPKWALGFWQSRERYKTQEEILSTVDEFRKRQIPIDNIVLDWNYWHEPQWGSQEFDETRFPAPDSMIEMLHKKYNTQLMISVWPKFYEGISTYNDFEKKGWLYKRNIADRQRDWIGKGYISTFYDAFNEDARKGFWDLIDKKLYKKGIDAWWMDASEPDILSNVSPAKRIEQVTPNALGTGTEYFNAYPLQNAKGIYEGQRATNHNKRVFLLTRSAFAGSQRYAAAVWSGDIGSTWNDMKNQIAAGVNFSMSGIPYWTMDIGGFVVPSKFEKPDDKSLEEWRELNTRWFQFGAFVPLFRAHGQYPFREIFNIASEDHPAYKSFIYYDKLRYRLMPYIYSLAGSAYHNDYTIMRGLAMDFPSDTISLSISDQYMFGPSLLVNPVCGYEQRNRKVYLPKCAGWFDFYNDDFYSAGQIIDAEAPYNKMPLFVKAGSIIPIGPTLQYVAEKKPDTIVLNIYTGADAAFKLFEDDGISYNYETGSYSEINFSWSEKLQVFTIGECKGSFTGHIKKRVFKIKIITANKEKSMGLNGVFEKEISYEGHNIKIKL